MDGFSFPLMFGAGVLSFLSPCVLPLVPPYLTYMSGASFDQLRADGATRGRAVAEERLHLAVLHRSAFRWCSSRSAPRRRRSGRRSGRRCRSSRRSPASSSSPWGCISSACSASAFSTGSCATTDPASPAARSAGSCSASPSPSAGRPASGRCWRPCWRSRRARDTALEGAGLLGRLLARARRAVPARRHRHRPVPDLLFQLQEASGDGGKGDGRRCWW